MTLHPVFVPPPTAFSPKSEGYSARVLERVILPAVEILSKVSPPPALPSLLPRLSVVEKRELVGHSLLNQPLPPESQVPAGPQLTALIGQVHADQLAQGTFLEELRADVGAQGWANFIQGSSAPPDLIAALQHYAMTSAELAKLRDAEGKGFAQAVIAQSKTLVQQVQALEIGKSFLLEGGYRKGKIDCPTLFEFVRTSSTHSDLFVYSSGEKESYHETIEEVGKKEWHHAIVHYRNVPNETFFTGDKPHLFIQTLLTARFGPQDVSSDLVHLRFLAHLQQYRHDLPLPLSKRNALTGAWGHLKGFVLRKAGDTRTYRMLSFEVKLRSLVYGYQHSKDILDQDSLEAEQRRLVLRKGAQTVLKHLALLYHTKETITEVLWVRTRATAVDLIDILDGIEQKLKQKHKETRLDLPLLSPDQAGSQNVCQETLVNAQKHYQKPTSQTNSIHSTRARFVNLPSADQFVAVMHPFVDAYQAVVRAETIQIAEIEHIISLMPIPSSSNPYWDNISFSDVSEAFSIVGTLLSTYFKALKTKRKEGASAKECNTIYALYAVIHHLALAKDRQVHPDKNTSHSVSLAHYPPIFPGMETDEDPFLMFTSPEDYQRRQDLIAYFKKTDNARSTRCLFNLKERLCFSSTDLNHPPSELYGLLTYFFSLANDPRFADQLEKTFSLDIDFQSASDVLKKMSLATHLVTCLQSKNGSLLIEKGFGHVVALFQATCMAFHASLQNLVDTPYMYVQMDLTRALPFFSLLTVGTQTLNKGKVEGYSFEVKNVFAVSSSSSSSTKLHPTLQEKQQKLFSQQWVKRQKDETTLAQEAEILQKVQFEGQEPIDPITFLRIGCEPTLLPSKLVAYYRSRLDLFQTFSEQTVFEIALFRSFSLTSEDIKSYSHLVSNPYFRLHSFPLADEMAQKGFCKQAALLIQEGVDRYLLRQPTQKPKILAITFFIRLACRLGRFNPQFQYDTIELLKRMLTTPGLTKEETSLLSLHLVLAYSTLKKDLSDKEVEAVFVAWVYYKNTPIPEWHNPLLEREVESFVHQASHHLKQNEVFQKTILTTALKQLGIQFPLAYTISATEPHIIEAKDPKRPCLWMVNILTGEALSENGRLRRTDIHPNLRTGHAFFHLFGENFSPSVFEANGCHYFSHPKLGMFRAVQQGDYYHAAFMIQKEVDGHWYQYVPPGSVSALPRSLGTYYTHWVSPSEQEARLLILHPKTGEQIAVLAGDGHIKSGNQLHTHGPQSTFLNSFERPEFIHWVTQEKEHTLHFWRYQSQGHTPLSFTLEKGQLIFNANRKFILSPEQRPGLLGATGGTLLLTHRETKEEKYLVALQPIQSSSPLTAHHTLDIQPSGTYANEYYADQKNKFEYLEFDVREGGLVPLTLEGTIYLCYQALAERKYEEALQRLKQIDFRDPVRLSGWDYLKQIVKWAQRDSSPEASAVVLHAWVLIEKRDRRLAAEGKKGNSLPLPSEAQATYSRYESQIPTSLLLNTAERRLCGLDNKSVKHFFNYPSIRDVLPPPKRGQLKIEFLHIPNAEVLFAVGKTLPLPQGIHEWERTGLVDAAKTEILKHSSFIPLEPVPSCFSSDFIFTNPWTQLFEEGFFPTAYEVARQQAGTHEERERLAFQLQVAYETQNPPKCWAFLQFALKYPTEAPHLPKNPKDYLARLKFINDMATLTANKATPDKDYTSSNCSPHQGLPERILLAPLIPPRTVEVTQTPLQVAPFSMIDIDGGVTERLHETYLVLKPPPPEDPQPITPPKPPRKESLSPEAQEFFPIIENEFEEFAKDFAAGAKINAARQSYTLDKPKELKQDLTAEIKKLEELRVNLESSILELANKHDPDQKKTTLFKEAQIDKEITLKKLADLFLSGDADKFAQVNPYLRDKRLVEQLAKSFQVQPQDNLAIDYLYNLMGLYMSLTVQQKRYKRASDICDKIIPLKENDLKRDALVQKLNEELTLLQEPIYEIKDYPAFLVFEYLSGISMHLTQARLLKKLLETDENGHYLHRVIQLIMGGGKTAVIAVVLLKLAAKKGRLSLFITPASQYASVNYNLRKALRDCFGIDMEEIEVTREQLVRSPTLCGEILGRLKEATEKGDFLLVKAETLQALGLQFLDFVYQVAHSNEDDPLMLQKINELREILLLLKERGDALVDEVDLVLNVLQEVNFPIGKMEGVSPERIEVVRSLFMLFMDKKAPLGNDQTIDLSALLGLKENRQNLITSEQWQEVIKAVAYNLPRNMTSLKLQGKLDFYASFERYLNKTMNPECQRVLDQKASVDTLPQKDRIDYAFLAYLRQLWNSQDPEEKEAALHIALVKLMIQVVLPATFDKTGNRNYGRGGTKPGEVRHYLNVDTPSENLFGYHWEAIAFHFQTALQFGITKEQLLFIAKVYQQQAEIQADNENVVFDKTIAAVEFRNLTSVALHELEDEKRVEAALQYLKDNIEALLRLEADTAAEYIGYFLSRLTSTGQSLIFMLATVRAMSGTPFNVPCYPKILAERFELALGTEGQIAHAAFSRAAKLDKNCIHLIQSTEIKPILETLLGAHPQKERVQTLMDSGALLKNYSNLEVATAIRDYLKKPVLFFMRNALKQEKTPDTLAILKVGASEPELIGGTKREDIQKTGVNTEECFVVADQRHTTGTDLPFSSDAIGLMTCDEAMLRRELYQTILRMREFFLNQTVEYVIPSYLLPLLDQLFLLPDIKNENLRRLQQITSLSITNQAIALSEHFERSVKQKTDETFNQRLNNALITPRAITSQDIRNIFLPYEPVVVTEQTDSLYEQCGAPSYMVNTESSLNAHRKQKLNQLKGTNKKVIRAETKALVKEAKASPYLPTRTQGSAKKELGMQISVSTETAQEVNQETDQDVEQNVLQELQAYKQISGMELRNENLWQDSEIEELINKAASGVSLPLNTLAHAVSRIHYHSYSKDYSPVFSDAIHITPSWLMATKTSLPVFHSMQRPLEHLLIVQKQRGEGYQAIVLSQHEAKQFKIYLKQMREVLPPVWLIQPDGSSTQDTPAPPFPLHDPVIRALLIECQVFNGRIDNLEAHREQARAWLNANKEHIQIKKNFLELKIADNPLQKKLFFRSEVFGDGARRAQNKRYRWMAAETQPKTQVLTQTVAPQITVSPTPQTPAHSVQDLTLLSSKNVVLRHPQESHPNPQVSPSQPSQAQIITKVVLTALGILVGAGLLVVAALALMGQFWPQAPQFTILLYHALHPPLILPSIMGGAGMVLIVGLVAFAIHQCKTEDKR
jgi:hypothetical protein